MGKDYAGEASLTDGREMCVIVHRVPCSASLLREIIPIVILTLDPCLLLLYLNKQVPIVRLSNQFYYGFIFQILPQLVHILWPQPLYNGWFHLEQFCSLPTVPSLLISPDSKTISNLTDEIIKLSLVDSFVHILSI